MTLTLIAIFAAIIGILLYHLRRVTRSNNFLQSHRMQLAEEKDQLGRRLSNILKVVAGNGGGVEKRITEHQEIVTAITTRYPAMLNDEPGLIYWLSASDQFYKSLKSATFDEDIFMKEREKNQEDDDSREIVASFFARIKAEMELERKGPLNT